MTVSELMESLEHHLERVGDTEVLFDFEEICNTFSCTYSVDGELIAESFILSGVPF